MQYWLCISMKTLPPQSVWKWRRLLNYTPRTWTIVSPPFHLQCPPPPPQSCTFRMTTAAFHSLLLLTQGWAMWWRGVCNCDAPVSQSGPWWTSDFAMSQYRTDRADLCVSGQVCDVHCRSAARSVQVRTKFLETYVCFKCWEWWRSVRGTGVRPFTGSTHKWMWKLTYAEEGSLFLKNWRCFARSRNSQSFM